jgi:lysozyme family protein
MNLTKNKNEKVGRSYMADYENNAFFMRSMPELLRWEGGYVDHPDDPGGATNFGISLRFYQENIDPTADKITIMNLKKDDAYEIYYKHFWLPGKYDQLQNFGLAKRTFCFGVNMGIKRANKLLQRALKASTGEDVVVDGIIGPKTLEVLKGADEKATVAALKSEAAGRYRTLAIANPKLKVFLKGWLNRAYA